MRFRLFVLWLATLFFGAWMLLTRTVTLIGASTVQEDTPSFLGVLNNFVVLLGNQNTVALKAEKGLSTSQNLRDKMDLKDLAFLAAAEALSIERMEDESSDGFMECRSATGKAGSAIRSAIEGDRRDRQKRLLV